MSEASRGESEPPREPASGRTNDPLGQETTKQKKRKHPTLGGGDRSSVSAQLATERQVVHSTPPYRAPSYLPSCPSACLIVNLHVYLSPYHRLKLGWAGPDRTGPASRCPPPWEETGLKPSSRLTWGNKIKRHPSLLFSLPSFPTARSTSPLPYTRLET